MYIDPGTYEVSLVVMDGQGADVRNAGIVIAAYIVPLRRQVRHAPRTSNRHSPPHTGTVEAPMVFSSCDQLRGRIVVTRYRCASVR
jgi:hypothetical protein